MTPDQLADVLRAFGYGAYVPVLLAAIGLAAKIAAVAPLATPASSAAWRIARAVLDVLGGNWGNARNAASTPPPSVASAAPRAALLGVLVLGFGLFV
jgi:hypothetical protein